MGTFQVSENQPLREYLEGDCVSIKQQLGLLDLQDRIFQMVDFHQPYYGLLSSTGEDRLGQSRDCLWGAVNEGKYKHMIEELKCAYAGLTKVDDEHTEDEEDEDEQTRLIDEYRLDKDPPDAHLEYIQKERTKLLKKYYSDAATLPVSRQHQRG